MAVKLKTTTKRSKHDLCSDVCTNPTPGKRAAGISLPECTGAYMWARGKGVKERSTWSISKKRLMGVPNYPSRRTGAD